MPEKGAAKSGGLKLCARRHNFGEFGRWGFVEFTDLYAIEEAFAALVEKLTRQHGG
jgi:hypothetical protein